MTESHEPDITRRKEDHIEICLHEDVRSQGIKTGLEHYRFRHRALPEIHYDEISTAVTFLGKALNAPLLISSMTGGTERAGIINEHLAEAAQQRKWALALGSARVALERQEAAASFKIRRLAPDIPLIANLGAVQLNYGYGEDECRKIVELMEADALVLHFNSLQEVFQVNGDTDFRKLLPRIKTLCSRLNVPVIAKEVGFGIDAATARQLVEAGVRFVDVAGAGGTSWIQVEAARTSDPIRRQAAMAFTDWGIPTAQCVREIREWNRDVGLIASGGLRTGVDAAKALALGADLAGFGQSLLEDAVHSAEALARRLETVEFTLRTCMFGIGASSIEELKHNDSLEYNR